MNDSYDILLQGRDRKGGGGIHKVSGVVWDKVLVE